MKDEDIPPEIKAKLKAFYDREMERWEQAHARRKAQARLELSPEDLKLTPEQLSEKYGQNLH